MKVLALTLLLSSAFAHAELLKLTPGGTSKEGVNIATSAVATVGGTNYDLTTVGAGLRSKRVLFDVKVYVAQLMVSDSSRFVRTDSGALASLDNETSVAIRLTFVRDVPASNVVESFQDALAANNVNEKDPDVDHFMKTVNTTGDAKNGGSLTIFLTKNADGTETLAYENLAGAKTVSDSYKVSSGMTRKIMSIWLGVPSDNGVASLKQQLLSGAL